MANDKKLKGKKPKEKKPKEKKLKLLKSKEELSNIAKKAVKTRRKNNPNWGKKDE